MNNNNNNNNNNENYDPNHDRKELSYICSLPVRIQKIAEVELNETEENREKCLLEFRTWIQKHPWIKHCNTDASFLLRFLRTKKFSVTRACQTLEKYLIARHSYPEFFRNLDCEHSIVDELLDMNYICLLRERDQNGRKLLIARPQALDLSRISSLDLFRFHILLFEYLMCDEETQVTGIVAMADADKISWGHLRLYNLGFLKTTFSILHEATPMRVNEMNTINLPSYFRIIANFLCGLLNEKMRKRFHFTSTISVDPTLLPKEYGGEIPMADLVNDLRQGFRKYRHQILALDNCSIVLPKKHKKSHKACSNLKSNSLPASQVPLEVDL
jgi:hypothetical protein